MRCDIFHGITIALWGVVTVPVEVGLIVVIKGPGMVTDHVWNDFGVSFDAVEIEGLFDRHEAEGA